VTGRTVVLVMLALLLLALAMAVALRCSGLTSRERLAELHESMHYLLECRFIEICLLFLLAYVILGALGLPVVTFLVPVGGYLFGWTAGTVLGFAGAVAASMLTYVLTRIWLGQWLQRRYSARQRWFRREINRHGASYLLILRLLLVVPFGWINTLAGLARIAPLHFLWTTAVGVAPAVVLYSYAGSRLRQVHGVQDVFSAPVMGVFMLAAALLVLRLVWIRKQRRQVTD